MRGFNRVIRTILVTTLASIALVACGGGGGGTSNPGFTGVQTSAVIDDTNAEQLALDAYNGGIVPDSLVVPLAAGSSHNQPLAPLGMVLFNSLPQPDFAPTVNKLATASETIFGTCGGSGTITATGNETSISGSISYDNYCEAGVSLNGSVSFSATFPESGGGTFTMSFSALTTGDMSLSGSMSMTEDMSGKTTMGMNIVLTDSFGQTYWVDHYSIAITPGVSFDTAVVSGTYHDFDAGHVVITTTDPLQVDNFTGIPESGALHFDGASGTYADLVATGGGGYTLTISTGTVITGSF